MKVVNYGKNGNVRADVPEDWAEAMVMLQQVSNAYYAKRGGNLDRVSTIARVAFGMFGEQFDAADPTMALLQLMMTICQRKGAGLEK